MDNAVFREIADEIKGLSNQAARQIGQGRYDEAEAFYQRALQITNNISYYGGTAMILFNLANLETLRGDLLKAMTYAVLGKDMGEKAQTDTASCDELLERLAKSAMKKGMEHENNGELKEALEYYYASVPFINEKYRQAMQKEIEIIERLTAHE